MSFIEQLRMSASTVQAIRLTFAAHTEVVFTYKRAFVCLDACIVLLRGGAHSSYCAELTAGSS